MSLLETFDRPFSFIGAELGNRMTVIRLNDGKLWVHSPIFPTDDLQKKLLSLGTVAHIICPNTFHHVHAKGFHNRYSTAMIYGVPGLEKKLAPLSFINLYEPETTIPWASEILVTPLRGIPKVNEVLFYHYSSKTLIVTDLLFNLHHKTGWTKIFLMLAGAHNKLGIDRVYSMMIKDKYVCRESLAALLDLDIDCIVLSHGDIVTKNATKVFKEAVHKVL